MVAAAVATLSSGACTNTITLENARPRVTWIAVAAPEDGDVARVTLWIADIEGNAVDVTATWSAGAESGDVVLAPGSYPLVGLPTREGVNDPNGVPHSILWDLSDVPDGAVELELEVDDTPHDKKAGDVYKVTLDPRSGTDEPVTLTR
ncbi:MAG: hypothetical protein U1F43_27445 [Myxococcota bacterium]